MNRPLKKILALSSVSLLIGSQTLLPPLPAQAQIFDGLTGCPTGTREGTTNFVSNGNFATAPGVVGALPAVNPAGFTSVLPYRGDGVYPDDNGTNGLNALGGLSIQTGAINYLGGIVLGQPFPGDTVNGVAASNTYLYSNPNASANTPLVANSALSPPNATSPIIWQQVVAGLQPNASYNFTAYFYNLLAPNAPGAPPVINFLAGPATGQGAFVPITPQGIVVNPPQQWQRVQGLFRTVAGQTSLTLQIQDQANTVVGDDFGLTAIGFRECIPILGVAKQAGTPVPNADGTYTIPYTLRVRNLAPANSPQYDLLSLQVVDSDLAQAFAAATLNSVSGVQSPTLTVDTTFNGTSNPNLLQVGVNTLPSGTTATITFNVNITPGAGPNGFGAFLNRAAASARSRGGSPADARSSNGVDPDPNNTGVPNPPSPTSVSLLGNTGGSGAFRLIKRITNVVRNGAPLSGVNFSTFIDGAGDDDNAAGLTQFQPGNAPIGQINLDPTTAKLQSGDDVEYTVYYLSDGTGPAIGVSICDPIPSGTMLTANTTQVQRSNGAIATGGTVFAPLAPLPAGNTCPDANNQNGTVIFDLGTIPNTTGTNFGLVRFRVKVN